MNPHDPLTSPGDRLIHERLGTTASGAAPTETAPASVPVSRLLSSPSR
ncbi:hypothetical protein [Kitasatospora sp. NRRL B-11411]|nr:hypothetical protein [Kitasatospora sp. NRRL B-11411]